MDILDTRENLNAMVLKHEQQIKDIAKHLLELQQYMEFKRREWVGLTGDEVLDIVGRAGAGYPAVVPPYTRGLFKKIEDKLREKNG